VVLRGFPASPFVEKVGAALRYKGLTFVEEPTRLLRATTPARLIEAVEDPVLVDGDCTIVGAARILQYLEEGYPAKPLYPPPPANARVQIVEEWVDRVLYRATQAVRWLVRTNQSRSWRNLAETYKPHMVPDVALRVIRPMHREFVAWRIEGGPSWLGRDSARANALAAACDHLDGALAETGWLAGPSPTVADLSAYAHLQPLSGLDGWETVRARKRIVALLRGVERLISPEGEDNAGTVIDVAEAQAFVDARRLSARPERS